MDHELLPKSLQLPLELLDLIPIPQGFEGGLDGVLFPALSVNTDHIERL
jgi:hypothetical protein